MPGNDAGPEARAANATGNGPGNGPENGTGRGPARRAAAPARLLVGTTDLLAACGMLAMMGVAFLDVLGRTFLNAPMPGATELMELSVAATVACAFPSLAWRGLHATIDVLDFAVPARLRPWQTGLADLLGAAAFGFMAWRVWIEGDKTARFGGRTPLLEAPMAPVLHAMAVLFAISALAFLLAVVAPPRRNET